MGKNLFSVPIFFIIFRETIEAGLILAILLSFVHRIGDSAALRKRLTIQIIIASAAAFLIALAIGAAFIVVFYTTLNDLWSQSEEIWEGCFSLLASLLILIMGIAFLKIDKSSIKWRVKLSRAFEKHSKSDRKAKYALFLLPFITVLREAIEAVVFVAGVSLSEPASSIPIAAITGILCGALVSFIIYKSGDKVSLRWFLVASTSLLFLVGAGLAARSANYFETYVYNSLVGGDLSESGDGPGSWDVTRPYAWHLTYGNPEAKTSSGGAWSVFNAILGWNNTAYASSVIVYCLYWLIVAGALIFAKWKEGRVRIGGKISAAGHRRRGFEQAAVEKMTGSPQTDSDTSSVEKPKNEA